MTINNITALDQTTVDAGIPETEDWKRLNDR